MNEAGMKRDYFYVMDYAAVLHDDNPTILFVGCVKSKWSNRISNFSKKKNVKQWLFIYDVLLAKIFSVSFFIITPFQQSKNMSMKKHCQLMK